MGIEADEKEILLKCLVTGMLLSTTYLLGKVSTELYIASALSIAEELLLHATLTLTPSELPLIVDLILEYDLQKDCACPIEFIERISLTTSRWIHDVRMNNFKKEKQPTASQDLARTFCSIVIMIGVERTSYVEQLAYKYVYEQKEIWDNQVYLRLYAHYFAYRSTMLDSVVYRNTLRFAFLKFYKSLDLNKKGKARILVNLI